MNEPLPASWMPGYRDDEKKLINKAIFEQTMNNMIIACRARKTLVATFVRRCWNSRRVLRRAPDQLNEGIAMSLNAAGTAIASQSPGRDVSRRLLSAAKIVNQISPENRSPGPIQFDRRPV